MFRLNRFFVLPLLAAGLNAAAYESMYEATPPGDIEVKTLPARTALVATGGGNYFDGADGVFMKLFRYIDRNKVEMTIPVESEVDANRMRFFAGAADKTRALSNTAEVAVETLPERTVLSVGIRGGYNQDAYEGGVETLKAWLEKHGDEWAADGEPYAVYWNGPFMPGFLKKSEVHWPVRALPPAKGAGSASTQLKNGERGR